ncbi:MAG: ribosomal RNA small subunit methyltransferase A [Pelagibacteraceae bacterium]|jgi:16S rRNA (adenine1518-N6/adenine1519-N6)-dimethyltransferase|nr:ribosomal RNA small subunit methyltransferase A [Pelagibacteraceae bacterium]
MIKPKKSLGQNFLTDKNIINKIINFSEINKNNILEIGPGTGNLTRKIIEKKPKKLLLVEKDNLLSRNLKNEFKNFNNVKIYNNDILKFDIEKNINKDTIIIGNLPYNVSSQILIKLIRFKKWLPKFKRLVLMFQKEVADKILASYGSEHYGRLAIITAAKLKVVDYFDVSPNSFYPVPKVKSTVLIFEPIINKDYKVKNIENLEKISHIFFSRKRKMINKAFKILFKEPEEVAKKIHIKLSLRPTRLTICEYFKIAKFFENSL